MPAVCLNPIGIEILRFLTVRFFLDFFVKNFQSFFSLPSSAESQQTLLSHILVLIRYCLGVLSLIVKMKYFKIEIEFRFIFLKWLEPKDDNV